MMIKDQARWGIKPEDFRTVKKNKSFMSYNFKTHEKATNFFAEDDDGISKFQKNLTCENLMSQLVINHRGRLYKTYKAINILLQVVTSYYYALLSAYRSETDLRFVNIFELLFVLDVVINCFLSFNSNHKTGSVVITDNS